MVVEEPETYLDKFTKRGGPLWLLLALALLAGAYFVSKSPVAENMVGSVRKAVVDNAVRGPDSPMRPILASRVVDQANIISSEMEAKLASRLLELEAKTSDQVVVATILSLNGQATEDYSLNLARTWAIGQKDMDNGVLILVAPNEGKVRIEVGYGLEGLLTNDVCAQIIADDILPAFRDGKLEQGILAGVDKVSAILMSDTKRPAKLKLKGRQE
jgi:uncharacterized protein